MVLTILALLVLTLLVVLAVYVFIALAKWPGQVARKRNHPQAEAIAVLSWGGLLLTAGIAWLVSLVWAHAKPPAFGSAEATALQERIGKLEDELAALKSAQA